MYKRVNIALHRNCEWMTIGDTTMPLSRVSSNRNVRGFIELFDPLFSKARGNLHELHDYLLDVETIRYSDKDALRRKNVVSRQRGFTPQLGASGHTRP